MKATNSTLAGTNTIFSLYKAAIDYQKIKFADNVWPLFSKELEKQK
ncbi:hypothetical protein [Cellulophaga fucicola]|nr:hypothetical protein [Cellulophaga fucicola]